jgi:hypothetical protein
MVDLKQPFLAAVETLVLLVVDTATCTARDWDDLQFYSFAVTAKPICVACLVVVVVCFVMMVDVQSALSDCMWTQNICAPIVAKT